MDRRDKKAERRAIYLWKPLTGGIGRVSALGAKHVLNYNKIPNWENEVLRLTGNQGVDEVLEVVGGDIYKSIASLSVSGYSIGDNTRKSTIITIIIKYTDMSTQNQFNAPSLEGKTVIVTGAANGIGLAEAELLALSGANVVFTDLDDAKGQQAVKPFGDKAVYLHHDVTKPSDWKNVIEQTIQLFGAIDGLVNNAGIYLPGSIQEVTEEILDRQINVNQKGTFWGIQYAAEAMKGKGGSIVNTSSICGIRGLAGCIIYNSTKWAIRGITKTAASELGQHKIRVNAVLPGFVETNIIAVNAPEMNEQAARDAALGRLGQPEDIAYLVRYLISDESSFVTGSDFLIDGGWIL